VAIANMEPVGLSLTQYPDFPDIIEHPKEKKLPIFEWLSELAAIKISEFS
jgi:hypothetical protein